jgi:hypothetical protein
MTDQMIKDWVRSVVVNTSHVFVVISVGVAVTVALFSTEIGVIRVI